MSSSLLTVHVCGAVKKEGVYTLPEGSRIRDAVEAAGGFDDTADTSYLNLAVKLEDAWQIRVPTKEEAETLRSTKDQGTETGKGTGKEAGTAKSETAADGKGSASAGQQKININTASLEELLEIPGIGESKARKIIEYREKIGRFEVIEDIMNVTGIKENSFRKMQDYITV